MALFVDMKLIDGNAIAESIIAEITAEVSQLSGKKPVVAFIRVGEDPASVSYVRKKEKTADMFKLMWSMKKKGDKPHYKPGTDKKYKKYQDESFEIDKSAHKTAQKKAKMRNLARGNENPNEKAAAEKKAGGPKLMGEGKRWDSYKKAVATVLSKKKEEKKPEKAMDAGAKARRSLQRREYKKTVGDFVPKDLED